MKRLDEFHGVTDAVEEIRIAEGDVLRAGGHLAANVFEHHLAADDSKHALVNRHDRAVAAKMLAAAARFRRANDAKAISGNNEVRVLLHRRHSGSIRHLELQPGQGNHGLRRLRDHLSIRGKAFRELHESFFEFAAENRGNAERSKIFNVHGSVQAVTTEMRGGILFAKLRNELRRQPRGGVHRQIDGDQPGATNRSLIERLPGKVEHCDVVPAFAQPRRRRRQAEGLPPELISRNENDIHTVLAATSIAARRSDSISAMIEGYGPQRKDCKEWPSTRAILSALATS
jgi:hypothetical protein